MKLVIDFPGLPPEHVADVATALYNAGFDAVIVGVVVAEDCPGDQLIMAVEPLEAG